MDFKSLKKELEQVFLTIQSCFQVGELSSEEDINHFVRLSLQFQTMAPTEWSDEAEDFLHLAKQLQQACKKANIQSATLLVESLDDAMSYCHRTFR